MGYGNKISLKTDKSDSNGPGPAYKTEYAHSIQQSVDKLQVKKDSTFGVSKQQQAKVTYAGQEKSLLGAHSPGPGIYESYDNVKVLSNVKSLSRYSIPKVSTVQ